MNADQRLRQLFFLLVVRPLLGLVIGLNVRGAQHLPRRGPALVLANHNSHLDVFVLLCLFPIALLPQLRAVAAADYFLANRALAWFSRKVVGILPIDRQVRSGHHDPLLPVEQALDQGQIVILFPEGTRGEPEAFSPLRSGVAHLARRHPSLPCIPVFLHGLGKALPRGEALLVPFFCDVVVGDPFRWNGDRRAFMAELQQRMTSLAAELAPPEWE
ncbi:MAG TPA: lysophospholipid acyltransferase family protein [Cyanobium sp.]|nr:lysophospholipid acyltransferase family protein [Cyanobium sp.]